MSNDYGDYDYYLKLEETSNIIFVINDENRESMKSKILLAMFLSYPRNSPFKSSLLTNYSIKK